MYRYHLFISSLLLSLSVFSSAAKKDTLQRFNLQPYLSIKAQVGTIVPGFYPESGNQIRQFEGYTLQYGWGSTGVAWKDKVYGNPNYGLGLHVANLHRPHKLGTPVSLYFFQSADIVRFNRNLSLRYHGGVGATVNWRPYDFVNNPENKAISTPVSAMIEFAPYLNWRINRSVELMFGVQFNHYSNGGTKVPNFGINLISPVLGLRYNLPSQLAEPTPADQLTSLAIPPFKPHFEHDLYLNASPRQIRIDPALTGLPTEFVDYHFQVVGLNYTFVYVPSYRFRYGLTTHLTYDNSNQAVVKLEQNYLRIKYAPLYKHFTWGVSLHGEVVADRVSIFIDLGYNLLQGSTYDPRFYQILGLKLHLTDALFATVGVKAGGFKRSQYMFWSIGYRFQ